MSHAVLKNRAVADLIADFRPDLLDGSIQSLNLLDMINQYLFELNALESPYLEKSLPEDMYISLLGLKSIFQSQGVENTSSYFEENKRKIRSFLRQKWMDW